MCDAWHCVVARAQGGNRDGRTMASDALKELFCDTLLPDRKLRFFSQQVGRAASIPA